MSQSMIFRGLFGCVLLACVAPLTSAQAPTPAQIQQIRAMTPEQRSSIANQLGIPLPSLGPSTDAQGAPPDAPGQTDLFPTETDGGAAEEQKSNETVDDRFDTKYPNLRPYGYSLFRSKPSTFSPVGTIPAPESYVIGPGDQLRISYFGKQSGETLLRVDRDGSLTLTDIGRFSVQGLSFQAVKDLIERQVSERKLGVTAAVTLDTLKSIQVFVVGEVSQPGSFVVGSLSTVMNALFVAGGVTQQGSLRQVELKRDGKVIASLDLYRLLLEGDVSGDQKLQQGDVIFVPSVGQRVGISGEVQRPGIFELKTGETLIDVLKFASGFSGFAFEREIRVVRSDSGIQRILKTLDASELSGITPKAGDLIEVLPIDAQLVKSVQVAGLISRPGYVEWHPELRLEDLLFDARGARFSPTESIVVIEEYSDDGRPQFDVIAGARFFDEPELMSRRIAMDSVVTVIPTLGSNQFPRAQFFEDLVSRIEMAAPIGSPPQTVAVSGAVRIPGTYPLPKSRSISDVITLAGGFSSTAQTDSLEVISMGADGFMANNWPSTEYSQSGLVGARSEIIVRESRAHIQWPQVEIAGRVQFPGTYRVEEGATLQDLIQRAGGLLDDADLRAAVFSRASLRAKEQAQLRLIRAETDEMLAQQAIRNRSLTNAASADEVRLATELSRLLRVTEEMQTAGRLVIDLPAVIAGRVDQNVRLEDGDRLVIPGIQQSVSVMGEVLVPTSHVFQLGLSPVDYLRLSGGTNDRADQGRSYVIRANGAVQPLGSMGILARQISAPAPVLPGDTIVIPRKVDDISALQLWTSVTQIIYQSAIAIAAIGAL
jgi:polysaccharide biosynthesis/export protein